MSLALTSWIHAPTIGSMLSEEQGLQLGEVLESAEQRLLDSAQQTLEITREGSSDDGRDSIDVSNSEELLSTNLRLRDREQKLLAKIRAAKRRLEHHEIDQCESCGGPISFKRLLARPVTTLCIACKESAEEQERRQEGAEEAAS